MPVLRSWRFWGALVALIITWRVTIKAEIRPLLCSAAAACVEALVCAVLPDRVEACNGVRIFPKVRKNGIDKYVDGYIRDKILIPQTL